MLFFVGNGEAVGPLHKEENLYQRIRIDSQRSQFRICLYGHAFRQDILAHETAEIGGKRIIVGQCDPDGSGAYSVHDEVILRDLMSRELDTPVGYVLGAHNMMYPFVDPASGETVHIIGFQGKLSGMDHLKWKRSDLYAGAMYAIRGADQSYTVKHVNGPYAPGKPVLVSPRTFARSPFGDASLFAGGHDSSSRPSDNMAWIFKASIDTVLSRESESH